MSILTAIFKSPAALKAAKVAGAGAAVGVGAYTAKKAFDYSYLIIPVAGLIIAWQLGLFKKR